MRSVLVLGLLLWLAACAPDAPESADVARAREFLDAGKPADAFPILRAEAERTPDAIETLVLLARTCQELGRIPRGVKAVERVLAVSPDHPDALAIAARLDRDRGRQKDAVEKAAKAAEAAPTRADLHALLGELRMTSSDPVGAAEAYEAASNASPEDPLLWGAWGRALVMAGEHADGLPLLDRYLRVNPQDGSALVQRGIVRMRARQLEGAEADFRAAIAASPWLPGPYHNLALVLQRTARSEEAAQMRERHAQVNDLDWRVRAAIREANRTPRDPEPTRALVELLHRAGRHQEAARYAARLGS